MLYIEWPSLPNNVSEKDYDACVEFLKSVRLPLKQENESLQVTDSLTIPNVERNAKLAAGYKLYPGVGWVHPDDLGNQQSIYRDNPNSPGELILDIDAMIKEYDALNSKGYPQFCSKKVANNVFSFCGGMDFILKVICLQTIQHSTLIIMSVNGFKMKNHHPQNTILNHGNMWIIQMNTIQKNNQ